MIHAYQETYLSKAQSALGEAFDYAVNTCDIPGQSFIRQFVASSISKRMENGEPLYLSGKSGIELARDVLLETTGKEPSAEPEDRFARSAEYWIGWAIAYYQWWSERSFSAIFRALTFEELRTVYRTLHETDISKFVDIADARIKELYPETNLKRIRTAYGCTQADLAKQSGVSLRSIQMYEQRRKDINKASVENVYRLAKALGCATENLIEH